MNMRMNFRISQGSQGIVMFRQTLLVLFLGVFVSALGFAAQAAPMAAGCDQMSMLQADGPGDCGGDGMANAACEIHCVSAAVIASTVPTTVAKVAAQRPSTPAASPTRDFGRAPETAPPKISVR